MCHMNSDVGKPDKLRCAAAKVAPLMLQAAKPVPNECSTQFDLITC